MHLFLSGLGRGVQEAKERWSHSAQEGEVLHCLCIRFPSFSTRSRCRSGEVRGWEFSLPENPSTTSVSSYLFFFFKFLLHCISPLLESACLALKMLRVPLLAGEGQAEPQCLILTA